MKAVILAAGEGTRMRPLTYTRPKVMLPIANKPILEHLLNEMKQAGISDFVFVVGYHDEQVRDYFGDGKRWDVNVQYVAQRKQLGTADAVKTVESLLSGSFLLVNGDVIVSHSDILALIYKGENTLGVIEVKDPSGLGVVEAKEGRVVRIYEKMEKPPTNLANAGVYMFTPDIFDATAKTAKSPRGEYEITDSIQLLIDQNKPVYCHQLSQWWDFSYPWDLLEANEMVMSKLEPRRLGEVEPNVVLKEPVYIGKNTVVRSGSYIVGPVIIGNNCEIGPNCYIRPSTAIGDHCHIGAAVEVKSSIIMRGSKVPHLNYVGDSIIGEDCNLGAGTKVANLRLDKLTITSADIDTGRRKLGVIMGDGVQTGINVSINIGCIIGNNTFIGPGALAHGVIMPNSKIF